jgi:hypothetical protein
VPPAHETGPTDAALGADVGHRGVDFDDAIAAAVDGERGDLLEALEALGV